MAAKVFQPIPEISDPIPGNDQNQNIIPVRGSTPGPTLVPSQDPQRLLRIAKRKLGASPHKLPGKRSHNHTGKLVHNFDCPRYGHAPKVPKPKNCRCDVYVSDEKVKALKKANAVVEVSVPRGNGTYRSRSFVSTIAPEVLTQAGQIQQAEKDAKEAAKEAKRQIKQQEQISKKIDKTKTKIVAKLQAFLIKQHHAKRISESIAQFDPELMLRLAWETHDPNSAPRLSKLEVLHPDVFKILNSGLPITDKKKSAGSAYAYVMQLAYEYFLTETSPDFEMKIDGQSVDLVGDIDDITPWASAEGTLADREYNKNKPRFVPEYDKLRTLHKVKPTGAGADDDGEFDHFAYYDEHNSEPGRR